MKTSSWIHFAHRLAGIAALVLLCACGASQKQVAHPVLPPPPPPQESLREYIPADAMAAVVVRKNAIEPMRQLLLAEPALRAELGTYLQQSLGVDLTELSGIVGFVRSVDGSAPKAAFVLRLPSAKGGLLSGSGEALPDYLGVPLRRLDKDAVAAVIPGALVLGTREEVHKVIELGLRRAPAVGPGTPLGALLTAPVQSTDLEVAVSLAGVNETAIANMKQRFGVESGNLVWQRPEPTPGREPTSEGLLRLRVFGDNTRLGLLRAIYMTGVDTGLRELEGKKDRAKMGTDITEAAAMILTLHHMKRMAQELTPVLEGNQLSVQFNVPRLSSGSTMMPMVGVLAAVAVPAFTKYMRRARQLSSGDGAL